LARVYLTGGLRVEGPAGVVADDDLPGLQGRLTLAILATERRPVARDELAELVWDGELPPHWSAALSAILSKLRALLTDIGLDGRDVVTSSGGSCAIRWPSGTWVDLEDAYRRLDRAEGALRRGQHETAARDATVASAVFRRRLLTGLANGWVDERQRAHSDALYRTLVALADAWTALGNFALAGTIAASAIRHDRFRETAYRQLVAAELARGDHGGARRAYEQLVRMLGDELGVSPSLATTTLIEQIGTTTRD